MILYTVYTYNYIIIYIYPKFSYIYIPRFIFLDLGSTPVAASVASVVVTSSSPGMASQEDLMARKLGLSALVHGCHQLPT